MIEPIVIKVADKVPELVSMPAEGITCDNSDYTVVWQLDEEWAQFESRTMQVNYRDGTYERVLFTGDTCALPAIPVKDWFYVGLFAGDIHTSRPVKLFANRSITTDGGEERDPMPDGYAQAIKALDAKLDKNQGAENAGKALVIGEDGNVVPGEAQGGGSLPAMSSDTAGKILTNNGENVEWGFGAPLTVTITDDHLNPPTINQTFRNLLVAMKSNQKIITLLNEEELPATYTNSGDGSVIRIEFAESVHHEGLMGAFVISGVYDLCSDDTFYAGPPTNAFITFSLLNGFSAPSTENIAGVTIAAKPFPADRQSSSRPNLYYYEASDPLRRCYLTDDGSGGYIFQDCLGDEYDPTPFRGGYQIFAMYYNFLSVVYKRRMYYKQNETSEGVEFSSGNGDVIRFGEGGIRLFPNTTGSVPKATTADKGKTLTVGEYGNYQLTDPAKQIMVVNFTEDDDGNLSADKSWDDVAAFIKNGGYVYAVDDIDVYSMYMYSPPEDGSQEPGVIRFSNAVITGTAAYALSLYSNGTVEYVEATLQCVSYGEQQYLTAGQQTQARKNIGLTPVAKTDDMTQSVGLDAETGELWTKPGEMSGDDILSSLIDANMMPAVTSAGKVLTDNNGKILLM